jgi:hypothetical protein
MLTGQCGCSLADNPNRKPSGGKLGGNCVSKNTQRDPNVRVHKKSLGLALGNWIV